MKNIFLLCFVLVATSNICFAQAFNVISIINNTPCDVHVTAELIDPNTSNNSCINPIVINTAFSVPNGFTLTVTNATLNTFYTTTPTYTWAPGASTYFSFVKATVVGCTNSAADVGSVNSCSLNGAGPTNFGPNNCPCNGSNTMTLEEVFTTVQHACLLNATLLIKLYNS